MNKIASQLRPSARRRHGAILIIALVVTATLTGMVLALGQEMRVEAMSAANRAAAAQADAVERGAEQYVIGLLTNPTDPNVSPLDLPEDQFAGVQVGDGYFWIVRPDYDDQTLPVYGLTEEGAKLNINTASIGQFDNLLSGFSGLSSADSGSSATDMSAAIDAWRNPASTGGVDDTYYSTQPDPYECKHAPFETVEEMLMVRTITRPLLYGDGTAPPLGVRTGMAAPPTSNNPLTDAQISRGLYDLLTVSSFEPTTDPDGNAITSLSSVTNLRTLLSNKISSTRAKAITAPFTGRRAVKPVDIFDLYARGQMQAQELDEISDYIGAPATAASAAAAAAAVANGTQTTAPTPSRRINVDTAPPAVLYSLIGVNGLQPADIDNLIAQRTQLQPEEGTIAWVADTLKQKSVGLGRYITARSYQYTADIVAVSGNGRSFKHVRIIVDASGVSAGDPAQIIYRRDVSDRGWPMDPQILSSLRAGQGVATPGANLNPNGGALQ